jgi:hypothetical protein
MSYVHYIPIGLQEGYTEGNGTLQLISGTLPTAGLSVPRCAPADFLLIDEDIVYHPCETFNAVLVWRDAIQRSGRVCRRRHRLVAVVINSGMKYCEGGDSFSLSFPIAVKPKKAKQERPIQSSRPSIERIRAAGGEEATMNKRRFKSSVRFIVLLSLVLTGSFGLFYSRQFRRAEIGKNAWYIMGRKLTDQATL